MNSACAAASLLLAALTAAMVLRWAALPGGRGAAWLGALTAGTAAQVLPVQAVAAAELLGWIDAVTFPRVAAVAVLPPLLVAATLRLRGGGRGAIGPAGVALPSGPDPRPAPAPGPGRAHGPETGVDPGPEANAGPARISRHVRWGLAVVLVAYGIAALELLSSYPDFWDSLSYHLPTAVRWMQDGSLRVTQETGFFSSLWGNAEITMMAALGTGWQALAALPNLVAAGAFILGCGLLARRCGATPGAARAAALVAASIPMVARQAFSNYVDLYLAGFLVAGMALLAEAACPDGDTAAPRAGAGPFLLAGLAWGLAAGAKLVSLPYVAALLAWTAYRARRFVPGRRAPGLALAAVLVGLLLPAAFWPARGWAGTGNPFHPLHVGLRGVVEAEPGAGGFFPPFDQGKFVRSSIEWAVYPWTEYKSPGRHYSVDSGLGAAFATFVPVGLLFAAASWVRRRGGAPLLGELLLLIPPLGLAWFVALEREPRFALPTLALAVAAAAPAMARLERHHPRPYGLLLLLSLAVTAGIIVAEPLEELAARAVTGRWSRAEVYGVPSLFDDLPPGTTVLSLPTEGPPWYNNFALAGRRLTNRVIPPGETPQPLTEEFLIRERVQRIWDRAPFLEPPAAWARVRLEVEAERPGAWRVWRVIPSPRGD